jgi:hypothetical protein
METLAQSITKRLGALEKERSSWISHWKDVSEHFYPRAGRFVLTDRNRGEKRNQKIIDSTGTRALQILGAGMMSGMTSPARPWFRLTLADQEAARDSDVSTWLHDVGDAMLRIFNRSNVYRVLHNIYIELGLFGTAAAIITEHPDKTIWMHPVTAGEYCIATNTYGEVDTFYRKSQMTVRQVVEQFGLEKCSQHVKSLFEGKNYDEWITIIHAIEPREKRDSSLPDALNMPFRSVYMEYGEQDVLRESGFKRFPVVCPRWTVSGGDIYGSSPAMDALGDVRQLQQEQLNKAKAINFQSNPPLQVPASLQQQGYDLLPGGITYVHDTGGPGVRTAFEVNLDLSGLREDIGDIRSRINAAFFADMFLMLEDASLGQMTATEVAERKEEKMLMLGPVLERLHNELLDPLISISFEKMLDSNEVPVPPDTLRGKEIDIEFVSMLAQSQKSITTAATTRFFNSMMQIAQVSQDVMDNVNTDEAARDLADSFGVNPKIMRGENDVDGIRQSRAQALQEQQDAAVAEQQAKAAKDLSQVDPMQIQDVMAQVSGY